VNNPSTEKLRGPIELLLENASRVNEAKPIKYWHPLAQATYGVDEILEALDSMCSFRTTMWEKTLAFEQAFAQWQGCKHAIMVNSGSSADLLMSFGLVNPQAGLLRPGDEILVPAVTWPTHIWSPMMAGLKVKLVDVNPHTLNVDMDRLAAARTPHTKAIFLVHLMGLPCPMMQILNFAHDHRLLILEDCCEAMGSEYNGTKVGNFGLASSFSGFFAHHFTTMEGGVICTNNDAFAELMRILRAHGWTRNVSLPNSVLEGYDVDPRYAFVNWGFNVRPTDVQAGFGLHQLQKVDAWNDRRSALAERFYTEMAGLMPSLRMPEYEAYNMWPSWFALPLMLEPGTPFSRAKLTAYLEQHGVETRPIVAGNIARHPVVSVFPSVAGLFDGADQIHERGFYIGLSPMMDDASVDKLLTLFARFPQ
jgi:CDP-6-deoxy-D-xylo-4-hexulose-3-dehydrase